MAEKTRKERIQETLKAITLDKFHISSESKQALLVERYPDISDELSSLWKENKRLQEAVVEALNKLDVGKSLQACCILTRALEEPGTIGHLSATARLAEAMKEDL